MVYSFAEYVDKNTHIMRNKKKMGVDMEVFEKEMLNNSQILKISIGLI